jgi:hypothetical protein
MRRERKIEYALIPSLTKAHYCLMVGLLFAFQMLLALASAVTAPFAIMGISQARGLAFNDGISPTSMNSGNTPQAALSTHYNRTFMENLKAKTNKLRLTTRFDMPMKAGQIFRNFMIQPLTANTSQQAEGTVGSGITVTTNFQDYLLGQWADFLNIGDKSFVTSISDDLVNY